MTKHTKTLGALAAATALMGGYAMAELEGEVNVGYTTMYEFRFADLGQDLVNAGADIAYDFGGGWGINGGAWYGSTNDAANVATGGSFNELDVYVGVSKELGPVDLELGYIWYTFPDLVGIDTQELYLSVGTEFGDTGLGANLTTYFDFEQYNGWYFTGELTYSVDFAECLSLDLAAGVGWAESHALQTDRNGGLRDGYQGFYVTAALPWKATDHLTVSPFLKYTNSHSDLLVTNKQGGQNHFLGGLSLSVAF